MPVNTQPPVRKRGRPPKMMQMTQEAACTEFDGDNKWGMVKLTKFACKLCGQTFNHQPNLYHHQITAHGRQKKNRGVMTQTTQVAASTEFDGDNKWEMVKLTKFACKLCGQTFNHQPNLYHHQITAHGRQKKNRGRRTI